MNEAELKTKQNEDFDTKVFYDKLKNVRGMVFVGESGGGFVKVHLSGEIKIVKIEYEKNDLIKDDIDVFIDLIIMAFNDAMNKMSEKFNKYLGD